MKGLRINKAPRNHELNLASLKVFKRNDTISDENTLELDTAVSSLIAFQNQGGQIWNVLACIRFACNPEASVAVFREFFEKLNQGNEVVIGSLNIVVLESRVEVVRVANTSRGLEEQEV